MRQMKKEHGCGWPQHGCGWSGHVSIRSQNNSMARLKEAVSGCMQGCMHGCMQGCMAVLTAIEDEPRDIENAPQTPNRVMRAILRHKFGRHVADQILGETMWLERQCSMCHETLGTNGGKTAVVHADTAHIFCTDCIENYIFQVNVYWRTAAPCPICFRTITKCRLL